MDAHGRSHRSARAPLTWADTGQPRPIGVGIVGLSANGGWAGRAHVPALSAVDGVELRALATSTAATADAAGDAYGVPAYTSVDDLVKEADVDLVVVSVKAPRHRELVLPVLASGVPVLSEWPLAVDLAEAREMERAAQGTRTFVGLQGRSSPTFRWLADLVSQGYVGEVLSSTVVASSLEWGRPLPDRLGYMLDRRHGATMLTIPFGHAIDLVTMVLGELEDVVATTATRRRQVPVGLSGRLVSMTAEDQIAVSGTLHGGAVLSVHHRGGIASGAGFSFVVDGTEGTLEASAANGFANLGPVKVRGARGHAPLTELTLPNGYDLYPDLAGTPAHTVAHAYAALRTDLVHGTTVAPDFAHAVKRHRLLDAIARSAATGRRVAV